MPGRLVIETAARRVSATSAGNRVGQHTDRPLYKHRLADFKPTRDREITTKASCGGRTARPSPAEAHRRGRRANRGRRAADRSTPDWRWAMLMPRSARLPGCTFRGGRSTAAGDAVIVRDGARIQNWRHSDAGFPDTFLEVLLPESTAAAASVSAVIDTLRLEGDRRK